MPENLDDVTPSLKRGCAFESQSVSLDRVLEFNRTSMQKQAIGQALGSGRAIQGITQNRVPNRLKVNSKLVRSTGDGLEFKPRCLLRFVPRENPPVCQTGLAIVRVNDASGAIWPVHDDRQVYGLPCANDRLGDAIHDCCVAFMNASIGEGLIHAALVHQAARQHHQTGGGHVKAMNNQRIRVP